MADNKIIVLSSDSLNHEPADSADQTKPILAFSEKIPEYTTGDELPTAMYGNRFKGSLAAPPYWIAPRLSGTSEELLIPGYALEDVAAKPLK